MTIEYAVIAGYLFVLIAIGFTFRAFNKDASDYFRNGCKGTWWLVGASAFMSSFSAVTFTAMAGAAFESGLGVTIIFLGNALGFFLVFLFLGPWYRQMRAITAPEVIRQRFGRTTQQFYAWFTMVLGILYAALWLTGLGVFASAVFDFEALVFGPFDSELQAVIVFVGLVVLIYSVFGGSWAVMATDFVQFLILIPLTVVVAVLALEQVGWIGGFFEQVKSQDLTEQFRFINDPAVRFADSPGKAATLKYGVAFAVATIMWKAMNNMSVMAAPKFFAVKDGREARGAALLACVMMALGTFVWFIPPMVARLLFADEVTAQAVPKPEETAYAVAAMRLLPTGLTGLMVVAMFAATMSSMDSGLNRNAAIFTRDILPPLWRWTGRKEPGPHMTLRMGQLFTLIFGLMIISMALFFAGGDAAETGKAQKGIFEHMLNVGALLGAPMAIPMLLALFVRRVPWWAAIATMLVTLLPSSLAFFSGKAEDIAWIEGLAGHLSGLRESLTGLIGAAWAGKLTLLDSWNYQDKIFANSAVGVATFFATMPLWPKQSEAYKAQVGQFFKQMHTPVDFEKEIGEENDNSQLKIMGAFSIAVGGAICLLAFIPQDRWVDHLAAVGVGGFVALAGAGLMWAGRTSKAESPSESPPSQDGA